MREREELKQAKEQSELLLSRIHELEEENNQLNKENNEVVAKCQVVSLRCIVVVLFSYSSSSHYFETISRGGIN